MHWQRNPLPTIIIAQLYHDKTSSNRYQAKIVITRKFLPRLSKEPAFVQLLRHRHTEHIVHGPSIVWAPGNSRGLEKSEWKLVFSSSYQLRLRVPTTPMAHHTEERWTNVREHFEFEELHKPSHPGIVILIHNSIMLFKRIWVWQKYPEFFQNRVSWWGWWHTGSIVHLTFLRFLSVSGPVRCVSHVLNPIHVRISTCHSPVHAHK